ncbi:hypothetical protein U1Q18_046739 [Sarracenia purpurea var. burkii]
MYENERELRRYKVVKVVIRCRRNTAIWSGAERANFEAATGYRMVRSPVSRLSAIWHVSNDLIFFIAARYTRPYVHGKYKPPQDHPLPKSKRSNGSSSSFKTAPRGENRFVRLPTKVGKLGRAYYTEKIYIPRFQVLYGRSYGEAITIHTGIRIGQLSDLPRTRSSSVFARLSYESETAKKRSKKATTAVGAGKLKQRDETKENDEKELDGAGGGVGAGQPTASKSSPTTKSPKLKTPTSPRTTAKPKIGFAFADVLYLRRRSNKKAAIDWKKPPKIPVKHTATSKARNENWFADCGRYRVKAFRGDWDNMPDELSADYELYERFFKHRKPVKKNTSLVKKLVEGKIDLQKPPIENKPFRKRSPVLPTASEKPKRNPKLKSSLSFRFGARGLAPICANSL